jgi:hypothetical protein
LERARKAIESADWAIRTAEDAMNRSTPEGRAAKDLVYPTLTALNQALGDEPRQPPTSS